jgi:cell division protein FtsB
MVMSNVQSVPVIAHKYRSEGLALLLLLVLAGLSLAGPSGVLAWSENRQLLERHQNELKNLLGERDELRNRVALLNPHNTDPDLAGELVRKDLNVMHPDDVVLLLDNSPAAQ